MSGQTFQLLIWNTIQKEVRSKTFFLVVALTFGILILSFALMSALSDNLKIENNVDIFGAGQLLWVYYSFINAWSIFLGLMFGLGCIRSDISSQVIGQLLALPIKRSTYITSRVLGSWALVAFYQFLSFALTLFLFRSNLSDLSPAALIVAPLISLFPILAAIVIGVFFSLWMGKATGLIVTGLV